MIVLTSAQEGGDGDGAFRPTTPPFASPFSSYFARLARRPGGGTPKERKVQSEEKISSQETLRKFDIAPARASPAATAAPPLYNYSISLASLATLSCNRSSPSVS